MRPGIVFHIFRKDLVETLRDRRTVVRILGSSSITRTRGTERLAWAGRLSAD